MRDPLVLSLLFAVATPLAAHSAPATAECAQQFLGEPPGPSLEQLQRWTRLYYPDLAAKAAAPARLVVGFVLDDQCRVLRHSVGTFSSDASADVDDIVRALFPGATQPGMPTGIGDAVPREDQRPWRTRLAVVWHVQISNARREQMRRERLRLRALTTPGAR